MFETNGFHGAVFYPVVLRKLGKQSARIPVRISSTGEPEDLITEAPLLCAATDSVGPYFQMLIQRESESASGTKPFPVCPGCGRENRQDKWVEFVFKESMWNGTDIFCRVDTPAYNNLG